MADSITPVTNPWMDWIAKATAATLLAGIIVTGYMGVWRWGSDYEALVKDRDEWKGLALKGAGLADTLQARTVKFAAVPPPPAVHLNPPETKSEVMRRLHAIETQLSNPEE